MSSIGHASSAPLPGEPGDASASHHRKVRHTAKVQPGEIAVGVVIGRASEYFDFFSYGIASVLVFPALFFPFEGRLEGTLYSFAIFSLAFLARPFGTAISMALQRRFSLGTKLTVALFLLGTSTVGMAFLPGYESIGKWCFILLAVFRIGQGLAFGGSWDGLPSLLAMSAPGHKRGWYAMMGQLGAPIGFMLASGLFAFLYASLSYEDFLQWGWRYAFFVAFATNVVALFARLRLVVAEEFQKLIEEKSLEPVRISDLMTNQGGNVYLGAFAALASYALFHLVTVYPLSWIQLFSRQSIAEFLVVQVIGGALAAGSILVSGVIADKIGRRRTLAVTAVLIAVFSGYAPTLLGGGTIGQDAFILIGFVILGLSYGQASGAVTANFDPRYRYTGAALTADFAWLIGAAFAPLVALGLSANFGLAYVSLYLLSGAVCTLVALNLSRRIKDREAA